MSARAASSRTRGPAAGRPVASALLLCALACGVLPLPLLAGGIAPPAVLPVVSSSATPPASMSLRQARHLGSIAPAGAAGAAPAQTPGSKLTVLNHSGDSAATGASFVSLPHAAIAAPLHLASGKSQVMRVASDIVRIATGNPEHAEVMLITAREVYVLGKKAGSTNVFLWGRDGTTTLMEVHVGVDTAGVQDTLRRLMPEETAVKVSAAGDSLVLSGMVADPVKVQRAVLLAEQFGGRRVINMLSTASPAQVMLEVKIAEVSKTVLDRLGARFDGSFTGGGNFRYALLTQLLSGAPGVASIARGAKSMSIDAEIRNGLVKILAEPTIMAVSGQEGTFLAGGKIYIPVPQSGGTGATVALEEKEFGVGLRFTPTVLEGGQINLRVTPEVSELSQIGVSFTNAGGGTSVLPSITTRRASTTVQLYDGQSFAIGGLVKNNVSETMRRFPGLGDLPVFGALFRSSEFQNDVSELLIIVTPRLVKPLTALPLLPTDTFVPPDRTEFFLHGKMEGSAAAPAKVNPANTIVPVNPVNPITPVIPATPPQSQEPLPPRVSWPYSATSAPTAVPGRAVNGGP